MKFHRTPPTPPVSRRPKLDGGRKPTAVENQPVRNRRTTRIARVRFCRHRIFVVIEHVYYVLTLDFERDPFANGRGHTVRGYTQISAHVEPTHARDVQHFAVDKIN